MARMARIKRLTGYHEALPQNKYLFILNILHILDILLRIATDKKTEKR